jgi:hypothetical protein
MEAMLKPSLQRSLQEELSALQDSSRPAVPSRPPAADLESFSPVHRNYSNLSARAPDESDDEKPSAENDDISAQLLLDKAEPWVEQPMQGEEWALPNEDGDRRTAAGEGRRDAAAVSNAAAAGDDAMEAVFLGRGAAPSGTAPAAGTRIASPGAATENLQGRLWCKVFTLTDYFPPSPAHCRSRANYRGTSDCDV